MAYGRNALFELRGRRIILPAALITRIAAPAIA